MSRNFHQLLDGRWAEGKLVCVWLNPDPKKIPQRIAQDDLIERIGDNAVTTVLETRDFACAYMLNSACYEAYGTEGVQALHETVAYLHEHMPEIPVILDAERSGSHFSNLAYAKFAFDWLEADAITVHPFCGMGALRPFLDCKDKGVMVACRHPNISAGAHSVAHLQNGALIVGEAYPSELKDLRALVGDLPILLTDINSEEHDVRTQLNVGRNLAGTGLMFAPAPDATLRETQQLHNRIKALLKGRNNS